jgi:predicted Mrr-cat superfamily restriction endonuclease
MIDKAVPIPRFPYEAFKEAADKMQVGDSVVVPWARSTTYNIAKRVLGDGNYRASQEGDGFRVWRIK